MSVHVNVNVLVLVNEALKPRYSQSGYGINPRHRCDLNKIGTNRSYWSKLFDYLNDAIGSCSYLQTGF